MAADLTGMRAASMSGRGRSTTLPPSQLQWIL